MKRDRIYRWLGAAVVAVVCSSCYYYPAAGGVAGVPQDAPYSPYADEKSASVPVYDDTYVPQPAPVNTVPAVSRPVFTLGIALPPVIFRPHGHGFHHHRHHCHH